MSINSHTLKASIFTVALSFVFSASAQLKASRDNPEVGTGETQQIEHVQAKEFMAATANPLATQAAYNVLKKGGSAIDAAIAAQAMLTLVEPQSSGIGGGAFILHHDGKQLTSFEGRETAPAKADGNLFMQDNGKAIPWREAIVGGRSVGVPGVLKALEVAHGRYGKLPWSVLFEDAIDKAENGFVISPRLEKLVSIKFNPGLLKLKPANQYFYPNGNPLKAGDKLVNKPLAASLRLIAHEGAKAFYEGKLAVDIVNAVQNSPIAPGLLSLEDMKSYQVKEREPVCAPYHARQVCSMGPPSSGGIAVAQQLALLSTFDLSLKADKPDVNLVHLLTQASRLSYADRDFYVADSDFVAVPVDGLLQTQYLAKRATLINPKKDMGKAKPGEPDPLLVRAENDAYELPSTSHLSIVDKFGNAVSMTTSIETAFGSGTFVGGFLLNNQLTDFALSPARDGKLVANRIEPNKRPRSSMAPTMVLDANGNVELIVGSPGGSNIINYVTQTLVAVLDWNMDIQSAISMPKVSNRNGKTAIEKDTYLQQYVPQLEAMGHQIQIRDLNSGLQGIQRVDGIWIGGADPRREGKAMGQ